jgi:ferredoxin
VGTVEAPGFSAFGLAVSPQGLAVDRESFATARPGVFAAGGVVRKGRLAVKSVADGRSAAISIAQSLLGQASTGRVSSFHNRLIRVQPIEVTRMAAEASSLSRVAPAAGAVLGFSAEEARHEASRCLHCDCARGNDCRLRTYAARYGAEAGRFRGERREVEIHRRTGDVVYEPGKCIACGLCVRITERGGEELGLTFIGRGFHVRIGVPFNRGIDEALRKVAAECIAACPTGALAHARRRIDIAG